MSSSQPSVLAVEDERNTRVLLRHTLDDFCDLTVVEDKKPALDEVDTNSFNLLLLDINLNAETPEGAFGAESGGVELLHAIRDRSDHVGVPAVAVTAYAMPGDRERLLNEGFDRYVEKPFTMDRLMEAIKEVLPES